MRIRSIKPGFWRSKDIVRHDWDTRLVFIGLWSYVDDNGVGVDELSDILGDLFAHDLMGDPMETLRRVSAALDALAAQGQVQRYEVAGKRYLFITAWDEHQRVQNPNKERYPRPTCDNIDPPETLRRTSVEPPETLSPVLEEEGRRGEEEEGRRGVALATMNDRLDVALLCNHLADRVEGNGSKRPTITAKWRDQARLLLDTDHRPEDEAHRLIDWSQDEPFWHTVILSMPKFREKYDRLRLQAANPRTQTANTQADTEAMFDRAAQRAASREVAQEIA